MFLPLYVWEGDDLDGISALQIFKHFFCQNFILKNVNLPNLLLPEFLPLQQNCLWVRVCMFYISCLIILIEMFSFDKKVSFLEVPIHYSLNVFLCSLCVESLLSSLTWGTDHKISFTFWTFVTFTCDIFSCSHSLIYGRILQICDNMSFYLILWEVVGFNSPLIFALYNRSNRS